MSQRIVLTRLQNYCLLCNGIFLVWQELFVEMYNAG